MKNVLILGGSKGLGYECVKLFLKNNHRVTVLSRSIGLLEVHENLIHIEADFKSQESVESAKSKILSESFDVIINNSGGPESKPFLKVGVDELEQGLKSHLLVAHEFTRLVTPKMIENKFGRIINIVSVTANNPLPNMIVSNTIRGAMINWSKTLSKELAGYGITVNNLLPGYTETQRLHEVIEYSSINTKVEKEKIVNNLLSQIPAQRFGRPDELARIAYFLSLEENSYINGQSIAVDGGWTPCI